jgi:hypothetical protein
MQAPISRRPTARPVVGALVALAVVAGVAGCSGGGDAPELADTPTATPRTQAILTVEEGYSIIESFGTDGPLTTTPGKFSWTSSAGGWTIVDGVVAVQPAEGSPADLAVTRLGTTEGLIQVTMPVVVNEGGIVFRYVDPANYWVVVGAPQYASWNLAKVVDGVATIVANTGLTPVDPFTTVGVLLADTHITVLVNGRPAATAVDPELAEGDGAGLYASGPEAANARWDEFVVLGVGVDPPPTPEPMRFEIPTPTPAPG